MIHREKIQQLSLPVVDIYSDIEMQILKNVAKKLVMNDRIEPEDINTWQFEKLQQLGRLEQEHIKIISKYAGKGQEEVKQLLKTVGYQAADAQNAQIASVAASSTVVPIAESSAILDTLLFYEKRSKQLFNNINTTILDESKQLYLDIINKTTAKVLTGVSTPRQALRQTVSEWAEHGVPALVRKDGSKMSAEAYVNMVTRSMSNTVSNEMQFARMDDYNVDLVEVSSHLGARPRCAPFQGRIFSRSGKSKLFPAWSSTSYGEAAGLLGVNCGHFIMPYVHGKSVKRFEPYDKKRNEKAYENSQRQRNLERKIRKAKRNVISMQELKDKQGVEMAKKKLRGRQKKLRSFIDETGRKRRYDREQIS
ncbi:phage minor capsid protein [Halobacillus sp. Cin3]|uniref:phage minor capsid protein n=1 Tax=Halobacillus sp. Cin3 TaxID=2928441 RepID=UPI00248D3C03|nr:phage minor capsid protein [Halobacillus sp. Cin3]